MIYQVAIVDQNHPQGYKNHHQASHCHHHRGITLVGTLSPVSLPLSPFPKSPPNWANQIVSYNSGQFPLVWARLHQCTFWTRQILEVSKIFDTIAHFVIHFQERMIFLCSNCILIICKYYLKQFFRYGGYIGGWSFCMRGSLLSFKLGLKCRTPSASLLRAARFFSTLLFQYFFIHFNTFQYVQYS